MFLIFVGIAVCVIIIMVFGTSSKGNKDTTAKENNENDDLEDFIIFNMINKHK